MTHAPIFAAKLLRTSGLLAAALALLTLMAGRADAQVIQAEGGGTGVAAGGPTEAFRLNAYGTLRGGGSWRYRGDGPDASQGLGVGGGLGVRLEIPIHQYVVLGPMLEYQVINTDSVLGFDLANVHSLNFGLWSKGRYVLDLAGNPFEVYVAIPIGLSIYVGDDMDTEVGVAVGLMFGAQLFINDRIGFLLETGFRRDGFRERDRDFDITVRLRTMQFVMNAGISVAL
jgi:hypothetical protein